MKCFLGIIIAFFSSCGTHNTSPISIKTVSKTGSKIKITNQSDTIVVGDTIGVEFLLPNPVTLDDSSVINIKNITKTGIGYSFDLSNNPLPDYFGAAGFIVENEKSAKRDSGYFYFNTLLMPLLGTTIHFIPKDTGTYILRTLRYPYLQCEIENAQNQLQIDFKPEFDVINNHNYLLDRYPLSKEGREYGKTVDGTPYYCFYVKHK